MSNRIHSSSWILAFCLAAALMALTTAWVAQYGFDLYPCELCLYQRLPYIGIVAFTGMALIFDIHRDARKQLSYLASLLFLTTAGVAFFHIGVEQEWWQSSCAPTGPQSFSFSDIQSALERPGQPACNDVPFTLLGISMAGYNFIAALGLAVMTLWAARQERFW